MNNDLAEMLRYNAWANRELLGACAALSDEQLDTRIQGISGSVRELHACADDGGPAGSDIVKVRNTPRKPGLFIALLVLQPQFTRRVFRRIMMATSQHRKADDTRRIG